MLYLYIYLAVSGLFFVATIVCEYLDSAYKGEGRCVMVRDVIRFLFLTQLPILNVLALYAFLEHLFDKGIFDKLLDIKLYKERI